MEKIILKKYPCRLIPLDQQLNQELKESNGF